VESIAALALPLISAVFLALFSSLLPRKAIEWIGCTSIFLSFFCFALLYRQDSLPLHIPLFSWISINSLFVNVALFVDSLSLLMTLIITGVGFLIHLYSIGYMDHDKDVGRYFSVMNFFIFSMLLLVLASDLLVLFVGWEGVGLASYLLIGFWYQKPAASKAAKKAFIVNRVGDLGLLLGILFAFSLFGTSDIGKIAKMAPSFAVETALVTCMTLLIFWAATAKSAQIPLHVWLPDAMEGPTPVSALIHAATMVTAGVYLVVRLHPLYILAPVSLEVVRAIGVATALFAAISALSQQDIKRVLAYSTISQLGLMFVACGCNANTAAMFHLTAHAFAKALLFLSAGNVIHMMAGLTDMNLMGGLAKYFPKSNILFLIGTLALSAVPPFIPFFSKELLLESIATYRVYYALVLFVSMLTAFYLTRAYLLTFQGPCLAKQVDTLHEAPCIMWLPVAVLAILSTIGGFFFDFSAFHITIQTTYAVACILFSIFLGVAAHKKLLSRLRTGWEFSLQAFYINELYARIFVRPALWLAKDTSAVLEQKVVAASMEYPAKLSSYAASIFERLQNGQIRIYLSWIVLMGLVLTLYILFMSGSYV
jgi:NADH-quinone oxidoreductase subunit L